MLTARGSGYAQAVVDVIGALNRELAQRVDPAQLLAAGVVLRAAIDGEGASEQAALAVRPPG